MAVLVGPAALGAFPGDNLSYLVGRRLGPLTTRRFFSTEKGVNRRRLDRTCPPGLRARLILACRVILGERWRADEDERRRDSVRVPPTRHDVQSCPDMATEPDHRDRKPAGRAVLTLTEPGVRKPAGRRRGR